MIAAPSAAAPRPAGTPPAPKNIIIIIIYKFINNYRYDWRSVSRRAANYIQYKFYPIIFYHIILQI